MLLIAPQTTNVVGLLEDDNIKALFKTALGRDDAANTGADDGNGEWGHDGGIDGTA